MMSLGQGERFGSWRDCAAGRVLGQMRLVCVSVSGLVGVDVQMRYAAVVDRLRHQVRLFSFVYRFPAIRQIDQACICQLVLQWDSEEKDRCGERLCEWGEGLQIGGSQCLC